jgi:hypothetical protein
MSDESKPQADPKAEFAGLFGKKSTCRADDPGFQNDVELSE